MSNPKAPKPQEPTPTVPQPEPAEKPQKIETKPEGPPNIIVRTYADEIITKLSSNKD